MRLTRKIAIGVFGVLGTLGVTSATIKPGDADSNVAAWLRVMGMDDPPKAMVTSTADDWFFWLGIVFLAVALFGMIEWAVGRARSAPPVKIAENDADAIASGYIREAIGRAKADIVIRAIHGPGSGRTSRDTDRLRAWVGPSFETPQERVARERTLLIEGERQGLLTKAELDREKLLALQKHRRALLVDCRNLAHKYTLDDGDQTFRQFLEGERVYTDIRGHLSSTFLTKLHAARISYANADGARYPALVGWFLDDLDRLESEWDLI